MKAKKIYEVQNFEQGGNNYKTLDIGRESNSAKINVYNQLEKQGVNFWLYYTDFTEEERKVYMVENIYTIKAFIEKLVGVGVDIKKIKVSAKDRFSCPIWKVMLSNRVISECLLEEDANNVVNAINAFTMEDYNKAYIEYEESSMNSINDRENMNRILNNLIANRKKYKNI